MAEEMIEVCNVCGESTHIVDSECVKCQSTDIGLHEIEYGKSE